jgi:hypothetical protein
MPEVPMTAFSSTILESRPFEISDQLTNLAGHSLLLVRFGIEIKKGQECPFPLGFALFEIAGDPADVVGAGGEIRVSDNFLLERDGRLDAADHELA